MCFCAVAWRDTWWSALAESILCCNFTPLFTNVAPARARAAMTTTPNKAPWHYDCCCPVSPPRHPSSPPQAQPPGPYCSVSFAAVTTAASFPVHGSTGSETDQAPRWCDCISTSHRHPSCHWDQRLIRHHVGVIAVAPFPFPATPHCGRQLRRPGRVAP